MEEIFKSENLIELHEQLNEFAVHHQNKGGQKAHQLIKSKFDEIKNLVSDGSEEGILIDKGVYNTYKEILSLLHSYFVP